MIMKIACPTLLATVFCLPAVGVCAREAIPAIALDIHPPQEMQLRDGLVIGRGQVSFQPPHSGYQVWLNGRRRVATPGRYVLVGKHNPEHQLRIRLTGEGWSAGHDNNGGITSAAVNERLYFDIVVDGTQQAEADEYIITASAAAIIP